jgi:hypothetical protein
MRFFIINTDYPEFLHWLYTQNAGLKDAPYGDQIRARVESLFGVADFYSSNLRKLGHEALDIYANNEFMQKMWAQENGFALKATTTVGQTSNFPLYARKISGNIAIRCLKPFLRSLLSRPNRNQNRFYDILAAQIKHYRPDVILNQAMDGINCAFLRKMKPYLRLLVGQHAATPLPSSENWNCYGLVISSFPPTIRWFKQRGIPAELHRLGFEPKVLSYCAGLDRTVPVSFVGSLGAVHSSRVRLLERVCERFDVKVWTPNVKHLDPDSPIRKSCVGQAWGLQMYQILSRSKITLNNHGDIGPYANNLRLYEATGVGALLITDWKENLRDMFEPGREVVAYRTIEECLELIEYYLNHDDEREAIASAGQRRTLRQHAYYSRMEELIDIIQRYV